MTTFEEEISALEDRRARALVDADVAALTAITDTDYVHVEANGRQRDLAGFLDALGQGGVRFARYALTDNLIRLYGETAVVTGGFENALRHADGRIVAKRGRHCRVYVRKDGRWWNVLHQGTEIAA